MANAGFLDVAYQQYNHCGVCLMLSSLSRDNVPGLLPLNELWAVGGETLRDFR